MAKIKYQDYLLDRHGNAIKNAHVLVRTLVDGTTTLWGDSAAAVPRANPVTTDADGGYWFYAASGHYNLVISLPDGGTKTVSDIFLADDNGSGGSGGGGGVSDAFWVSPTGFSGTDVQTAINTAQAAGYKPVILPPGTYTFQDSEQLTISAAPDSTTGTLKCIDLIGSGSVVFDCSAYTTNKPCILVRGQPGSTCTAKIQNIHFRCFVSGGGGNAIHIEVQGMNGFHIRDCVFHSGYAAVWATNTNQADAALPYFTEDVVVEDCTVRVYCKTTLRYYRSPVSSLAADVALGHAATGVPVSFHGTGLKFCNIETNANSAVIVIEDQCHVYNAPLFVKMNGGSASVLSANYSSILIDNANGSGRAMPQYYGAICYEQFPDGQIKLIAARGVSSSAARSPVYFAGSLTGIGGSRGLNLYNPPTIITSNGERNNASGFTLGDMVCAQFYNLNSAGKHQLPLSNRLEQFPVYPGANSLGTMAQGSQMRVRLGAENYVVQILISGIRNNGLKAALNVQVLTNYDVAGFGLPTFSVDTDGVVTMTNPNFPPTTNRVTCMLDNFNYSTYTNAGAEGAYEDGSTQRYNFAYSESILFDDGDVNVATNEITLSATSAREIVTAPPYANLYLAKPVVYRTICGTGGGDTAGVISPLVDGATYYVYFAAGSFITGNPAVIQLSTVPSGAQHGTSIVDLASVTPGTGVWTFSLRI